jgi:tryptophanyl-tRNA synthetase
MCGSEAGTIYLLDPPELIRKKLKSAVTDSGRDVIIPVELILRPI